MQNETTQKNQNAVQPESKKPNETGSIRVEGFVKIYDPNSKEIFVEKRA
jgi:hypothetical protein